MPANIYHFLTEWHVDAPRELIYEILKAGQSYPLWWPAVYLEATQIPSELGGAGNRIKFLTRGWLPYRLRWMAEVVRTEHPQTIEIVASGDLVGRGIWQLQPAGAGTRVTFDWQVRADKKLLSWLSPLFKPVFEWNHRWAMKTGFASLCSETRRRQSS